MFRVSNIFKSIKMYVRDHK